MKTEDFQHLLLRSAVTVMACDGSIDDDEINEIKRMAESEIYFMGYDFAQPLMDNIDYIKANGTKAVNEYLNDLTVADLNARQEILLIEVLIRTIEADSKVQDSEIKFLQLVKSKLNTTEETLITKFPKQMNYLIDSKNYGLLGEFTDEVELE